MDGGLIVKWDILELSCTMAASHTRSDIAYRTACSGQLLSEQATTPLHTATGIKLTMVSTRIDSQVDALGTGFCRLEIPALGIDQQVSYTGGAPASIVGRVEIDNIVLRCVHVLGEPWYFWDASDLRFYAQGALVYTHGATISLTSGYYTAAGIPLIGIPPTLRADALVSPVSADGGVAASCAESSLSIEAISTVTDGWRFKEAGSGSWSALPVNVNPKAIPSLACTVTSTAVAPTAGNTYAGSCQAKAWLTDNTVAGSEITSGCQLCSNGMGSGWGFTPYTRTLEKGAHAAQVTLLPALTKSVKRWGDGSDYGALIKRWGFPKAESHSSNECRDYDDEDPTSSNSYATVFGSYPMASADVQNAAHTIENPFGIASFAPYSYGGYIERARNTCVVTTSFGTCPPIQVGDPIPDPPSGCVPLVEDAYRNTISSSFGAYVETSLGNPDMHGAYDHLDGLVRYLNYCCHPHAHYLYYFPANTIDTDGDNLVDAQAEWEIGGIEIASEYWQDLRTQWLIGGARNSLVSAPLRDGKHSYWIKSRYGTETSWWGISRFKVRQLLPATEKTLDSDSASLWSATNATLTHGANIVVNPSTTTPVVKLDLGSLNVEWWYFPHLAKSIMIDWLAPNVVSVNAYLESIDGSSKVFLGNIAGTTYAKPITGTDTKYAGSWKQDFGVGYLTDDEGADSLPSGISGATMTDMERVMAFQLLSGQAAAFLRFEIEVADPGVDMTLKYPKFVAPTTAPFLYNESGHQSCIVWADGPGVRWGSWRWWDYAAGAELSAPVVEVPGTQWGLLGHKSTVLDALRYENLFALGKSYDDGVATIIASLYDSTDGNTKAKVAYDTLAFLVKSNSKAWSVLVNTYAETPPLAMFPVRARDTDMAATGAFAQESWSYAQKPRRYIAADTQLDVAVPGTGALITSTLAGVPAPWKGSEHSAVFDGTEPHYNILFGAHRVATGRPWHGYFAVPKAEWPTEANWSSYDVSKQRRHVIAVADAANLVSVGLSENTRTLGFDQVVTAITATAGCIRFAGDGQSLILWTVESGAVLQRSSTTEGQTFSVSTSIGAGSQVTAIMTPQRIRYIYRRVGATIVCQVRDSADNILVADTTVIASGVDDRSIDSEYRPLSDGSFEIVLWYIAGGVLTEAYSSTGLAF